MPGVRLNGQRGWDLFSSVLGCQDAVRDLRREMRKYKAAAPRAFLQRNERGRSRVVVLPCGASENVKDWTAKW